jgi:glycosyltransferase involved in cell wall biosynthesis
MEEEDATDILMIDSDESWNPEHLIRLLFHEEDIVCGVYRKCCIDKIDFPVILCTADDGSHLGKMLPDGNCLLEAKRVPAGFLKISKRALKRWVEAFPDRWIWYGEKRVYAFFGNEIRDHSFNGMDFCFTDSMREAGLHVWVDPICEITHWGIYPFKGTLDAKLRALKANQEAGNAFSIVEQMAKDIEDGKCS